MGPDSHEQRSELTAESVHLYITHSLSEQALIGYNLFTAGLSSLVPLIPLTCKLDNQAADVELKVESMDEWHMKIEGRGTTVCQGFHSLLVEISAILKIHNLDT